MLPYYSQYLLFIRQHTILIKGQTHIRDTKNDISLLAIGTIDAATCLGRVVFFAEHLDGSEDPCTLMATGERGEHVSLLVQPESFHSKIS